jgi:uncharacterized protein involved in outer membrane biogenesis
MFEDAQPKTRKLSPRMRKAAIAVVALAAVVAAGLWGLSREATLIWAAQHVAKRTGGRLEYDGLRGSLLGAIEVHGLSYRDKFGTIAIAGARMHWRPIRLLIGQVAVGAMSADTVRLTLVKNDEARKPPESLRAPIAFAVTDFRIGKLTVANESGTHEIRDLTAAFSGGRHHLHAELKSLATQYGNLKGEVKIGADAPFELEGRIALASPEPGVYGAVARLGGSLLDTEATLHAKAREATVNMTIAVAPYDPQPLTRLDLAVKDFDPRAWVKTAPGAAISGEAHIGTDAERRVNGAVVLTNASPGTIDAQKLPFARFSAAVAGAVDRLALSDVDLDLGAAGRFAGSGRVENGELDVNLATNRLDLSGIQKKLHRTALKGRLALGGDAQTQRVTLALDERAYRVRLKGALRDRVAHIDEAYARAGDAEVTARGRVALNANKDFAIAGRLSHFDPSQFGRYAEAHINSRFDLEGRIDPVIQVAANVSVSESRLFGLPATATGTIRSKRSDHPEVAMDVQLRIGDTRATARGTIADPAKLGSMDMQLTLAGANLAELYKIARVPLPPTPPYLINGRLVHTGEVWALRQFSGVVGDSDLSGDFLLDRGRAPQFLKADLTSKRLDLADLAGFVGAEKTAPGKVATPQTDRVLPDTPYSLEKLGSADADVRFEGRQVLTEKLPIDNMSAHLILRKGVLTLDPLDFGVAGGKLVSQITLDGSKPVIASRADIRVQSLQLSELLPKLEISKASVGEMDGRIRLAAHGNSVAAMLGSANGDTELVVGEGEVSDLMLRLSNLDIANTLLVLMRGDRKIPIRCMVADLNWDNGVVRPKQFVFDTAHTTLFGEGQASFANETLDLRLVAKPKDRSLLSLRGPINVRGTFGDPSVMPDLTRLGARGAAAAALAVVAPPLAVLPFVQLGGGKDVQCGPLVQSARQAIRAPGPPPQQFASARR